MKKRAGITRSARMRVPPLPKGEGWGEGEQARATDTSSTTKNSKLKTNNCLALILVKSAHLSPATDPDGIWPEAENN